MTDRFVSVGDDFNLPAVVNVLDENLPANLQPAALSATYATIVSAITGEASAATVTRINAVLAAVPALGIAKEVRLVGNFTINAPLVVQSNTVLNMADATFHLPSGLRCNMLQNKAVRDNRRCTDAAITAAGTTVTSASLAFTSADVGKEIRIWDREDHEIVSTITAVTNATTATIANAATYTASSAYASIGARDRSITIIGGYWDRGTSNTGTMGYDGNTIRLRHVDGLTVKGQRFNVLSGKYSLSIGDCTGFGVDEIYSEYASSDCVHINGPARLFTIKNITSRGNGDDIVSLTGGDFWTMDEMSDTQGSITDGLVQNVKTVASTGAEAYTRGVLLLAGQNQDTTQQFKLARVNVRDVETQLTTLSVQIGGDSQDVRTMGGVYENILVDGARNHIVPPQSAPGCVVRLRDSIMTNIDIRSVRNEGGTVDVRVETGVTVTGLKLTGLDRSRTVIDGVATGVVWSDRNYGSRRAPSTIANADRLMFGIGDYTQATSGTLFLSYFQPDSTFTPATLTTFVRDIVAAGTTLARVGIYEADSGGSLTLVAASANTPTLWTTQYGAFGAALTTAYNLKPNKTYAIGVLFVGTTAPRIMGKTGFSGLELLRPNALCGSVAGQTDLPATVASGSITASAGAFVYARLDTA